MRPGTGRFIQDLCSSECHIPSHSLARVRTCWIVAQHVHVLRPVRWEDTGMAAGFSIVKSGSANSKSCFGEDKEWFIQITLAASDADVAIALILL